MSQSSNFDDDEEGDQYDSLEVFPDGDGGVYTRAECMAVLRDGCHGCSAVLTPEDLSLGVFDWDHNGLPYCYNCLAFDDLGQL